MLSYVENGDDFSYQELKLQIEPLGIFDKTIDKLILKKLNKIDDQLESINGKLDVINNNIINGFNNVVKGLDSINNKLLYNNIISTINTFQLYRINKKLG